MWYNNKGVVSVYCSNDAQHAWGYIQGLGWRRIKPGAVDGVTNTFVVLTAAKANGANVNVYIVNDLIERAMFA